jgi:hypothetical protein
MVARAEVDVRSVDARDTLALPSGGCAASASQHASCSEIAMASTTAVTSADFMATTAAVLVSPPPLDGTAGASVEFLDDDDAKPRRLLNKTSR